MEKSVYYQVEVLTGASRIMKKRNSKSEYVLHTVKLIDGPCEGQVLVCHHTVVNSTTGIKKPDLEVGEIALFYPRILEDSKGNKRVTGELSKMVQSTASEEILHVLETVGGIETVKISGEFVSVVRDQSQVLGS